MKKNSDPPCETEASEPLGPLTPDESPADETSEVHGSSIHDLPKYHPGRPALARKLREEAADKR